MLLVRFMYGLGNQMFQYAFGRSLEKRSGLTVKFDKSWYEEKKQWQKKTGLSDGCQIRDYKLGFFPNLTPNFATPEEIQEANTRNWPPYKELIANVSRRTGFLRVQYLLGYLRAPSDYSSYDESMFRVNPAKDYCYKGFFQNERYFHDISDDLRHDFTFPQATDSFNTEYGERISRQNNAVCLHVRRGDYAAMGWTLPLDYYGRALSLLRERIENPFVYLFGDGAVEVAGHLFPNSSQGYEIIPPHNAKTNQDYRDMQLMSLCQHFIIANSTFSWWAAWLGAGMNSEVFAPKPFIQNKSDIICPHWHPVEYNPSSRP